MSLPTNIHHLHDFDGFGNNPTYPILTALPTNPLTNIPLLQDFDGFDNNPTYPILTTLPTNIQSPLTQFA